MAERSDLAIEMRQIREELEDHGAILDALLRASPRRNQIVDQLRSDAVLSRVLLLVDGERSQNDIVDALRTHGLKGASPATVSRKIDVLATELGLVSLVKTRAAGKVYRRTRLERGLQISESIEKALR